jgi:hypothetical protein
MAVKSSSRMKNRLETYLPETSVVGFSSEADHHHFQADQQAEKHLAQHPALFQSVVVIQRSGIKHIGQQDDPPNDQQMGRN